MLKRISFYFSVLWLPLFLAVLFVIQNLIFNEWTNLTPNPFLSRLIIVSFALGLIIYGPSLFFRKPLRYIYLSAVSLLVSTLFLSQYLYFSYFGGFLQASALKYAGQASSEWGTIRTLLSPWLLVFFLNVIVVVSVVILSWRGKIREIALTIKEKTVIAFYIGLIALSGYAFLLTSVENGFGKIANFYQTLREINSFVYSPNEYVEKAGIFNYYLGDIAKLVFRDFRITPEDILFVQNWSSQKQTPTEDPYTAIAKGRNLIIIQIESLENAVIGKNIDKKEITPNINALTQKGLYFNNYYTQVGPGNTADAEFVTLNSLYPITNTVAFIDFAHNTYNALPDKLKQDGYDTYALHGDVSSFWNRSNIYPALGYENSITKKDFIREEPGFDLLSDRDFFSQSAEKMRMFHQPFMATLITLSSHTPFYIPKNSQSFYIPDDLALSEVQKNYIKSIHYTDEALGEFIKELKKTGLYENSLIVIYGDHGGSTRISEILDGTTEKGTLSNLRESRVPLIIIAPGAIAARTISIPGSHLDLFPTIADLLGIAPPTDIAGQDLLNTKTPVVTRRDPYLRSITSILTKDLAYEGGGNGTFEKGKCLTYPDQVEISITKCKNLYEDQLAATKASDLIVKGNLIPILSLSRTRAKLP